jgi:hypothetical protein
MATIALKDVSCFTSSSPSDASIGLAEIPSGIQ